MKRVLFFFVLVFAAGAFAQTIPYPSGDVPLRASNTQAIPIPPSTASTPIAVVVDSGAVGDFIDILTSDPNVAVSLILPSGTAITAANASSLGFALSTFTSDGSSDVPSFSMPARTR